MAASAGIQVTGYKECVRALNKMEKETKVAVRAGLKLAAQPVAMDARSKLGRFQGASLGTIGPRVTTKGVFVTQRAKKVTGRRPDFGGLQMSVGLIPALEENQTETVKAVELAFGKLVKQSGF